MAFITKIKRFIKKAAEAVLQSRFFPNRKIIFESVPDMSCQTYPVYEQMLELGLNKKYRLIWFVGDKDKFKNIRVKNVKFRNINPQNRLEKIGNLYCQLTSRAILYTNRTVDKIFDRQLMIYLKHGTCIKSRLKHCRENETNNSDFVITPSHFFDIIDAAELHIPEGRYIDVGYPRNDYILDGSGRDFRRLVYPYADFDKIILWMPTFRLSSDRKRLDSSFDFPLGLPCLYTADDCEKLNKTLSEKRVLLVLKPHPMQNLTVLKTLDLSNIRILHDSEIASAGIQLYQFVGSCDALVTDYSSIYYDFMLTGRIIGLTTDDYEVYKKETGFVFDDLYDALPGERIADANDFIRFAEHVAEGTDSTKPLRDAAARKYHAHTDNKSTERVCDFILSELKKRYGSI